MSQQSQLKCQQSDNDFTLVIALPNNYNKENCEIEDTAPRTTAITTNKNTIATASNYRTISASVVRQRRQERAMVELEKGILSQSFQLIETYYRPTEPHQTSHPGEIKSNAVLAKAPVGESAEGRMFKMPRKRVYGLSKAYQTEFKQKEKAFSSSIHRDLFDWQFVFASVTGFPARKGNLAKDLNYDSLFDYEDAIALTACLLANARQHSDLIDGLTLCRESAKTVATLTDYEPQTVGHGGSKNFDELLNKVRQLVSIKKQQLEELIENDKKNSKPAEASLLKSWFLNENMNKTNESMLVNVNENKTEDEKPQLKTNEIKSQINAWEEFIDIVEILKF